MSLRDEAWQECERDARENEEGFAPACPICDELLHDGRPLCPGGTAHEECSRRELASCAAAVPLAPVACACCRERFASWIVKDGGFRDYPVCDYCKTELMFLLSAERL